MSLPLQLHAGQENKPIVNNQKKMVLKLKDGGVVDPAFWLRGQTHVLKTNGTVYSVFFHKRLVGKRP